MSETTEQPKMYRGEALVRWFPHNEILERAVIFEPGYSDTVPHRYGKHGMGIRFLLRGPKGGVQFLMDTGWVPGEKGISPRISDLYPSGSDLGYHAKVAQYAGAEEWGLHENCEYIGGKCYYDGSGLAADEVLRNFIRDGERAVWEALEERYADLHSVTPVSDDEMHWTPEGEG